MNKFRQFTGGIFFADNLLNWFLGLALTTSPALADRLMGQTSLLPASIYRVIGLVFLLFAAWQSYTKFRGDLFSQTSLWFAGLMSLVPVIMLTVALLFMAFPLKAVWRVILWVGNIYMLFLGSLYLAVARDLRREP